MTPATEPPPAASFETAVAELEKIVRALEDGQLALAESLEQYETGVRLLKQCYGLLDKAQRRIEQLVGVDAAGNPVVVSFDDTATAEANSPSETRSRRRSASKKAVDPPAAPPPSGQIDEPRGLF